MNTVEFLADYDNSDLGNKTKWCLEKYIAVIYLQDNSDFLRKGDWLTENCHL